MSKSNHGFVVKETRFVKEINANVIIYQHTQTGARLMHIDADDDNKVFTIGFRTPPDNHTGVPHILEHAVLCGSEKYPTKEPFVELLKGSLYTFLNAMTAPDFTLYPVASMNNNDFRILVEVYLDAVFFPNIKKIDEIFYQEGWHYEMMNKEDELTIKGVVYNEMQGAFSAPNSIIAQKMAETVFPDSTYKNCAGGMPEHIPELTLDEFRHFHDKYYHPSNSYIYLYGKMDIDEMLSLINDEALKRFTAQNIDSTITQQKLFTAPVVTECVYPVAENESESDKTWFALKFLVDLQNNPSLIFSFEVIAHLLMGTPAAPLKNAFLEAGICKDVFGGFDNSSIQPAFYIVVKDSNIEHKEKALSIFFDTLKNLCEKGIDKQLIEASINIKEFHLREADMGGYPKGLMYIFGSLNDWVHDLDPIESLCYEDVLRDTKASLTTPFYESLIKKYLIENKHYGFITMNPEKGLAEKNYNEMKAKLAEMKSKLSDAQIAEIVSQTQRIYERQNALDSKEDLEKLPTLKISDVNPKAEDFSLSAKECDCGATFLEHDTFTNGIVYLNLYFEQMALPQHMLPYATVLTYILGQIHTKNYHYGELSNLINIDTGGFSYAFTSCGDYHNDDKYRVFFNVSSKALFSKTEKMIELLTEITQNTLFDEVRLREMLNEFKSRMEMSLMQAGHAYAGKRLAAYVSEIGKFDETTGGVEFYFFLKELLSKFDQNKAEIIKNFEQVYKMIFNKNNLYISITSPQNDIEHVKDCLKPWITTLDTAIHKKVQYKFNFEQTNEGFVLPGNVQYVAKGHSYKKLGFKYAGAMEVMGIIVSLDYLWNKIRVQGGAYGAMFNAAPTGMLVANSYRDPNLAESLDNYNGLAEYLKNVAIDEREFTKYMIGAVRKFDVPKTPPLKSYQSDLYYFIGKTQSDIQKQRDELLSADVAQVKAYCELLEKVMQQNVFCVFGSEAKIKENAQIFGKIVNVF